MFNQNDEVIVRHIIMQSVLLGRNIVFLNDCISKQAICETKNW